MSVTHAAQLIPGMTQTPSRYADRSPKLRPQLPLIFLSISPPHRYHQPPS